LPPALLLCRGVFVVIPSFKFSLGGLDLLENWREDGSHVPRHDFLFEGVKVEEATRDIFEILRIL
jgi:hypothetical protein